MPTAPPSPANILNVNSPSGVSSLPPPSLTNYNLPIGVSNAPLPYNVSQPPHVVTTPISLPGMPPITVSASLPQNHPYYTPILNPNQAPTISAPGLPPTTASAQ